jgi:uncharacterized protein (UPF0264 family)
MDLLVSVRDHEEAAAALAGDADVIDAKDPVTGALGAVPLALLRRIHEAVGGRKPVTAALGDAADEHEVEELARAYAGAGTAFVKVGFAGTVDESRATMLLRAAVRGAAAAGPGRCGVVAVGYADASRVASPPPLAVLDAAAAAGAAGVLLDTADKAGPGLLEWMPLDALRAWIDRAHRAGLRVALAGRVAPSDLPMLQDIGADIVGVRGAACDGGRNGRVTADRVRALQDALRFAVSRSG